MGEQKKPKTWRRCGNPRCGRLVQMPAAKSGEACKKCGEPLSRARKVK